MQSSDRPCSPPQIQAKPRLLDQVRGALRRRHYSLRTEQSYVDWIKRFILFNGKRRLRVKDVDFGYGQILVRDGKGAKDRVTMLPATLAGPLRIYLDTVRAVHQRDLDAGYGAVGLPHALERKYPSAPREWSWQYVFPAGKLSVDPRSGAARRHHLDENAQ